MGCIKRVWDFITIATAVSALVLGLAAAVYESPRTGIKLLGAGLVFLVFVLWTRARRNPSVRDLGLDLSVAAGFRGFRWGTPSAEVELALGRPDKTESESGVTSFWYQHQKVFFAGGAITFIFLDDKLVAGECISAGKAGREADRVFHAIKNALTRFYRPLGLAGHSSEPLEVRAGVFVWVIPYANTRIMLHGGHPEPGLRVIGLTFDDGRDDNELSRLSRYETNDGLGDSTDTSNPDDSETHPRNIDEKNTPIKRILPPPPVWERTPVVVWEAINSIDGVEDGTDATYFVNRASDAYDAGVYQDALELLERAVAAAPGLEDLVFYYQKVCRRVLAIPLTDAEKRYEAAYFRHLAKPRWFRIVKRLFGIRFPFFVRCKWCGRYTAWIDPNTPTYGSSHSNNWCTICHAPYHAPSWTWDSPSGRSYSFHRQSHQHQSFDSDLAEDYLLPDDG